MTAITLPHNWSARSYQKPFWDFMENGGKRAVLVRHRRAGKDSDAINWMAVSAFRRPGLYYYMAPTQKHARKIVWDNIDNDGFKPLDRAIPHAIRERTNAQEMIIETIPFGPNGERSIIQVLGSDNYDSIVGSNPCGIVFSEWGLADKPEAWQYLEPSLVANDGWAIFPSTPRGMNHFNKLARHAENNEDWYYQHLTIRDTWDEYRIVDPEWVESQVKAGMLSRTKADQEYYCKFLAENEKSFISPELIHQCVHDHVPPNDDDAPLIMGVDVALEGDDSTVFRYRHGLNGRYLPSERFQKLSADDIVDLIIQRHRQHNIDGINIDTTGNGVAVAKNRRLAGLPVCPVNFAGKSVGGKGYKNKRAEIYGNLRQAMMDGYCMANDDRLHEELAAIEFVENISDGSIKLEPKVKVKDAIGRSPDDADAEALLFARAWSRRGMNRPRQTYAKR